MSDALPSASATSGTPVTPVMPVKSGSRARPGTWLYQPVPAPDFTLRDLDGHEHSLSSNAGHPVLLSFWTSSASSSRALHCGTVAAARAVEKGWRARARDLCGSRDGSVEGARPEVQGLGLTDGDRTVTSSRAHGTSFIDICSIAARTCRCRWRS